MTHLHALHALPLNEIRDRVARFVDDYRDAHYEMGESQSFWTAFLRCFGIDNPYTYGIEFERPAKRASTGRHGRIDVFQAGVPAVNGQGGRDGFLAEQKSRGAIKAPGADGRTNAETQAQDYLDGGDIAPHEQPRWVIVSDFATMQIIDRSLPMRAAGRAKTIALAALPNHVDDFLWLTGRSVRDLHAEHQTEVSIKAARLMGNLYAAFTADAAGDTTTPTGPVHEGEDATLETSILMTRLLFLMFGDDAGLWTKNAFQSYIATRTSPDGSDLGSQLTTLFEVLNTPDNRRNPRMDATLAEFPYVNGDIFADRGNTQFFDSDMRDALLAACDFDWSSISPAVFGSLFQTVKSKDARRADGEHYTSETNILKVLGPMFLDDLRDRVARATSVPQLEAIHDELRHLRYADPACGCGNFLIVAYREMRRLELDLIIKIRERAAAAGNRAAQATYGSPGQPFLTDPTELLHVTLDQFYGIELNWWPAKIAATAMFLTDHQANRDMARELGVTPNRLPIRIAPSILHTNALMADWVEVLPGEVGEGGHPVTTYVFGNPPFLGRKERTATQLGELQTAWGLSRTGHLDFVTAWHAKALAYLARQRGEFGFVTTNSISQGEQVADLFPRIAAEGWRIKFAHRTFGWDSESASKDKAAVHCVIVGFTRDVTAPQRLFLYDTPSATPRETRVATSINGYLLDGPEVTVLPRSRPLSPSLPPVSFGSMPRDGGNLIVSPDQYDEVAADPVAQKYLRRYVGAEELINGRDRWCLWMTDLEPSDVPRSSLLQSRLAAVAEMRASSAAQSTREWATSPHLFVQQAQPLVSYLCIPRVFSESRRFATAARFGPDVIASDATFTCEDPDGFAFAVLSSSMFITWQRAVGGRLKSDPRFSKDLVWNSLPLPAVDPRLRRQIVAAGEGVLSARALFPDRPLALHYNPLAMSRALVDAHRELDRVVDKAFGAGRSRMSETARQAVLFARYAEMDATAPK